MKLNALVRRQPGEEICFGSPSLAIAPDGSYLASHDFYYPREIPADTENEKGTVVYRSTDGGERWEKIACIAAHWASLFTHRGQVYLMGCDRPFGNIVIFRSSDHGFHWTTPIDGRTGLLFKGGQARCEPNYHTAPTALAFGNGRIYRAYDDVANPDGRDGWKTLVVSAPDDADLLDAASWVRSNAIPLAPETFPPSWHPCTKAEWLEGNMVTAPDGKPQLLMRLSVGPNADHAAKLTLSSGGTRLCFDPETGYLDLPGGGHKFMVRRDARTGWYLAMGNNNTEPTWTSQRNILTLSASRNLVDWTPVHTLVQDDSDLPWERSVREIGFQYPDFQIEGDDVIYLLRTAYDGTTWFHDANQITFHRLQNFRSLLPL